MQDNQSQIARLSTQVSTGQRMLSAKDDPLSAQKAMQLSSHIAVREQYLTNLQKAGLTLNSESTVLDAINKTLTDARALLSQSNGSDTQPVRDQHADMIAGMYVQLKDLLNSRDTDGHFIFAGSNTQLAGNNPPFQHTPVFPTIAASGTTTYLGTPDGALPSTQGVRSVAIGDQRNLQVTDNLQNVVDFPTASPVAIPYFNAATNTVTNVNTTDILQAMDQVAIAMHDTNLTTNQAQSGITAALNAITGTLDHLGGIERRVAAAQVQIKDATAATQSLQTLDQNALSDLTLVDKTAAIVELQSRQTSLQAAESAYAQTRQLSLFNYL
jgi:flagellar hook-associated protein 3 FlgL